MELKHFFRKLFIVLKTLSVEPASLCIMASTLMSHLVFTNFLMDRVCRRDLKLGPEVCDGIVAMNKSYHNEEISIQMRVSELGAYRSLISNSVPILFVLFWGAWSDIYGRKLPMLLGIGTLILQDVAMIGCALWEEIGGLGVSMILSIPPCLTGGRLAFSMAAYSHISHTSSISLRTLRIGILSSFFQLGVPLGFSLGGTLLKANFSYPTAFLVSVILSVVAFFIILIRVENQRPKSHTEKTAITESKSEKIAISENLKRLALGLISVLSKKRNGYGRIKMWVLLVAYICVAGPIHGEFGVMYLFLRARFSWDAGDYGTFSIYNTFISVLGVVVSMGILSHWAKLPDPIVGFIAGIGQLSACFMYAFGQTPLVIFLAPLVDMMNGTMWVVAKAMVSKLVEPEEYGRIFTLFSVITALVPLVMDPAYAILYKMTAATALPGCVFLLSAALTAPPQITFGILSWLTLRKRTKLGNSDAFCSPKVINVYTIQQKTNKL